MKLDRIVLRYILDTNGRFQALKAGEAHVMEPQPQLQIAEFLRGIGGSSSTGRSGTPRNTSPSSSARRVTRR